MGIFTDLIEIYEADGITEQSGLNADHFPGNAAGDIAFTYFFRGPEKMCKGGGIALAEIAFLEKLSENFQPRNIFAIGNAFGWSTLALALANPQARVVAIDLCPRPEEKLGLDLTNRLAKGLGLDVRAIKARSPEQVRSVAEENFDGPVDFVFIDGGHNNQQIVLDFQATQEIARPDAVYLFHDVVNFLLWDGFVAIAKANPEMIARILFRTPSGMGICYPPSREAEVGRAVHLFAESDERLSAVRAEGKRLMAEAKKNSGPNPRSSAGAWRCPARCDRCRIFRSGALGHRAGGAARPLAAFAGGHGVARGSTGQIGRHQRFFHMDVAAFGASQVAGLDPFVIVRHGGEPFAENMSLGALQTVMDHRSHLRN